jgi:hypothetical protein
MREKLLIGLVPLLVSAAFAVAPTMAQANTLTSVRQEAVASGSIVPAAVPAGSENVAGPLWTERAAAETALVYAAETWGNGPRLWGCYNTGVNKAGYVQWECEGYFEGGPNYWYVGIGPYGSVLEAYKF